MASKEQKIVVYWCSGCKREIIRKLMIAKLTYESVCERAGNKTVKMKRLGWRYA